ncbi:MAG: STAS domain-containing protein [Acidobacteriaceae bacterium]|nr:STAS domain-containing protein [Acidobacteriaceae bacterium]
MNIEAKKLNGGVVLKISGRMDAANASVFQKTCEEWIAGGAPHLVLDLSELQYVSSMGLGCFLAVSKALQAKGGSLLLCQLKGLPKQVFELTHLIELFRLYDSTDAALASLLS